MTIVQKAQRFDEAIERARKELQICGSQDCDAARQIFRFFPELAESEDERIRKEIIAYFTKGMEFLSFCSVSREQILAWLEKQGTPAKLSEEEQNRFAKGVLTSCAMSFIDYLDAHKYEGKMCVSNGECEDIENAFLNAMWDRLHRYYCKYIEKQGEHKEDATRYKIAEYLKKLILDQSQRSAPMFNYEGRIEEEVDFIINIAKKELKLEEQGEQKEATCVAEIIDRLSEKEQEILFKELNMQKEHNKFIKSIQIGDQVTRNQDGMLVNLSQLKRVAKPSENKGMNLVEEEMTPFQKKVFCIIDTTIEEEQGLKQVCDELFALASNEIKQNPAWSKEDENLFRCAIDAVKQESKVRTDGCLDEEVGGMVTNWLKSLKDRVLPQNFTVTDEELIKARNEAYNDALDKLEYHSDTPTFNDGWSAAIWYLKKRNTMPHNTWKPSDEQMEALHDLNLTGGISYAGQGQTLIELYNDLKKLREK